MDREPDGTIVVEPKRKGSPYKSIELQVFNYETTVEDENGVPQTFKFRLLTPHKVDEKHYFSKNLLFRLENMARKGPKERRYFYSFTLSMIDVFKHSQPGIFRRDKKFDIRTMDNEDPFEDLLKLVEKADPDAMDLLERLGKSDFGIDELMDYALFKNDIFVTSMWDQGYRTFRDIVLGNLEEAKRHIERLKSELLDTAREIFETSDEVDEAKRAEMLALVEKAKSENPKEMRRVTFSALRRIFVDCYLKEKERTEETTPIGEKAYRLIADGVSGIDLSGPEEDVEKALAENFNELEFNKILSEMMCWFEEKRGIIPIRIDSIEKAEETLKKFDELAPDAESVPAYYDYLGCFQALFAKHIIDKYKTLAWIAEGFLNRTYYLDRLYRESERVYLGILESGYRQVYEDIKHIMTREEKRAYKLAHFPQPYFDGRIAIEEPRIMEFAHIEHKNTRDHWVLRLVFDIEKFGKYEKMGETLKSRWRSYLRVYPTWVELVRSEDRDKKREKKRRKMTVSSSTILRRKDESGNDVFLEDILKGSARFEPDRIISRLLKEPHDPELHRWVVTYCTPAQKKTIETMFFQGYFLGIDRTAALLSLDEKTVYDHVKDGRDRIVSGLIRDALFPESKFPRKPPRLDLK
ncbi:MAG TPA: hypothetical protein PKH33_05975 [bacterium]|nr:hypothetical protein [bacterium]